MRWRSKGVTRRKFRLARTLRSLPDRAHEAVPEGRTAQTSGEDFLSTFGALAAIVHGGGNADLTAPLGLEIDAEQGVLVKT